MTNFWKFFAQSEPHLAFPKRCFRCFIPTFWASPFPKTLVIWASSSNNTLAVWVRVRVTGDAHITRLLGMGCPNRGDAWVSVTEASLCHKGVVESRKESARGAWYFFFDYFCNVFVILSWSFCGGKRYSTLTKKWYLLVVTRNEMKYNFKTLGQLFRHKSIKVPWYEPFKSIIFFLGNNC